MFTKHFSVPISLVLSSPLTADIKRALFNQTHVSLATTDWLVPMLESLGTDGELTKFSLNSCNLVARSCGTLLSQFRIIQTVQANFRATLGRSGEEFNILAPEFRQSVRYRVRESGTNLKFRFWIPWNWLDTIPILISDRVSVSIPNTLPYSRIFVKYKVWTRGKEESNRSD